MDEEQKRLIEIVQREGFHTTAINDEEVDFVLNYMKHNLSDLNQKQQIVYMQFCYLKELKAKDKIKRESEEEELIKRQQQIKSSISNNYSQKKSINSLKNLMRDKYLEDGSTGSSRKDKHKR